MRVLQFHNRQLTFGGVDVVLENERNVLRSAGHVVESAGVDSASVLAQSAGVTRAALKALWNAEAVSGLHRAIDRFDPDLVHYHTVYPVASPAVLRVAAECNLPSLVTHHSYRTSCVASTFLRDDRLCTDCVGKRVKWQAVSNRCYRSSAAGSLTLAVSSLAHRSIGSWDSVTLHIALSNFGRRMLELEFGPNVPVVVSPNFVPLQSDASICDNTIVPALLFFGRLNHSKGAKQLVELASASGVFLTVVGDGPLREMVSDAAAKCRNIDYFGQVEHSAIPKLIRSHAGTVFTSTWPEACPMSVLESYAHGRPVLMPGDAHYSSFVEAGTTGEHYRPGSSESFGQAARSLIAKSLAGRYKQLDTHFQANYSATAGLARLESCYRQAVNLHGGRR